MPPIAVAFVRAAVGGFVLGGAAAFGQLSTGASTRTALISGGVAFFGYLILRGGIEGFIDQKAG